MLKVATAKNMKEIVQNLINENKFELLDDELQALVVKLCRKYQVYDEIQCEEAGWKTRLLIKFL